MSNYLKIGIAISLIALLVGFLFLPESTRNDIVTNTVQISDQTMQLIKRYCSDNLDTPREYLLAKIREQFPDYPEEGICGLYERHDPG